MVNDRTVGRVVRILRRRKGMTQRQLGGACGLSQGAISKLEAGRIDHTTIETVRIVLSRLNAELSLQIFWREGIIDRLLDERHAALVGQTAHQLRRFGWVVAPEVSYSEYGERGSIDLLGSRPAFGALVVVEVKTDLISLEATLRKLDEKARLAPRVARERLGWQASSVGCVLVLLDESTARRRVARHAVVLDQALPARGRAVSRWIRQPAGSLAGIWFLSDTTSGNWARVSVSQMRERSCESPVLTPKLPPSSTRGDI
ncbi:MAG: helix-turn-helix transcriptional regulator [Chloroflexi bacterium]|nr:MAG: helix-turn-helix transcriptional regulator [Chloroflexota bacterium]